jgi:hypothetical protein
MRRFISIAGALFILSGSLIAFAQSNGAKPSDESYWKTDKVVCQKTVEGVTFIYGFIDGQWQALEEFEEEGYELLDCDTFYGIDSIPVS